MAKLDVIFEESFKEPITSLELADVVGDGKNELVISTLNGDIRVFVFQQGKKTKIKEIAKTGGLPPLAAFSVGDILGNGCPDFVVGGLDNYLRVLVYLGGKLEVRGTTPVGTLPTALMVANVVDDSSAEVIVATNDKALRCYGWYDVVLDKLAHKVVERPVFSMQPLRTKNLPYSRFVFGDDTGYLYLYQYADDRLHEITKIRIGGDVNLVSTGNITGSRYDEIAAISNGRNLTLLSFEQQSFEKIGAIKMPNNIASIRMGRLCGDSENGQILLGLSDSSIITIGLDEGEMVELASAKTKSKARESMIAFGDITGDSQNEVVQAVGNDLLVLSLRNESELA
ncbi:MAG: hypothetical protein EAX95_02460 [Candidatus Thorarchaeota archaeon]|nr:hypothetical protein [Candidatus Thorarchaeota archaeon]